MSTEEALEMLLSKVSNLERKIDAFTQNSVAPDLLNISEAAAFLRRKPKTLYTYVSEGRIPHIKNEGRLLFSKTALQNWLIGGQSATNLDLENRMISLNQKRK